MGRIYSDIKAAMTPGSSWNKTAATVILATIAGREEQALTLSDRQSIFLEIADAFPDLEAAQAAGQVPTGIPCLARAISGKISRISKLLDERKADAKHQPSNSLTRDHSSAEIFNFNFAKHHNGTPVITDDHFIEIKNIRTAIQLIRTLIQRLEVEKSKPT